VRRRLNLLRCILLLLFTTTLALGQAAHQSNPPGLPNQPAALVRSFYHVVVARHPHDIPEGAEMKIFAPYLSKALLHRIDLAKACSDDWDRQNPDPHLRAEMSSKFGLFYGERWNAGPRTFKIERTQSEKDGSSRVYVNLTSAGSPARQYTWHVAAVMLREDGHSVIDDVIYINDSTYEYPEEMPADRRLSEYLAAGCNGPRWIGYSLPNQPEALIHSLYEQVVAHAPGGIPSGIDWKIFAPYLSKTLLHRIDDFNACVADWDRQYPDPKNPGQPNPNLKPPFGVYESGIFSGGDELTGPRTFNIERTQAEKDGSVRVYVRLTWWDAPVNKKADDRREYTSADKPVIWQVAPIVVREKDRLVVDDVVFLKDAALNLDADRRLSQSLSQGCAGPRWVGYREQPDL
jgi:hypothetical protein